MNGKKNHIDRIFNSKLRNWEKEPPSEVWDHIRDELDRGMKKKGIAWFAPVAASIAILTVLSLSYLLIRNTDERRVLTLEQSTSDSVFKETEKTLPVYAEAGDMDEEEPVDEKSATGPGILQIEKQTVDEKRELLAEFDKSLDESIPVSELVDHTEGITGPTQSGIELAFMEMNYISNLDYRIPYRERKPAGSDQYHRKTAPEEPVTDENLDELYLSDLPGQGDRIEHRWAVGTQVSPIYSYRSLGMGLQKAEMNSGSTYDQIESGLIAYAGGVNVNYIPAKRISIQSGIYYSKIGLSVDYAYFLDNTDAETFGGSSIYKYHAVSNSSGTISVSNGGDVYYLSNYDLYRDQTYAPTNSSNLNTQIYEGEIIQNFDYLEVPMIVRFKLLDRKLDFNLLGGLSTNFLIGSNAYFLDDGSKEKIGKTTDIKSVNYSSIIGMGLEYAISKRLNLNLEPIFRYYLNSINKSSAVSSHPYSVGLFTGLSFYF
ncbi:MAG: hypothetical protein AMS27_11290 [Bacteroides sp. SM23_62_1]|nr:MAG: hypothetical protein AMS27_11290 [Bacteroides sp. SM23_62_1]